MNISIKRTMMIAGLTTAMALPLAGQASDGTITFSGSVTANTCTVSVNGTGANATVTLPTVSTSALTGAASKTTAAGTFFSMTVSACTGTTGNVAIYFEAGPNVDEATGGLINTASSGSNVEVNLYNASGSTVVGTQILPGGTANSNNQPTALTQSAGGTQWFYAGYSTAGSDNAAATSGAVSTTVTYSLIYS